MHVGLDVDGTITKHPALFAAMSKGLRSDGHKVSIVTYRFDMYREETAAELASYGVQFDELHMLPLDDDQPTAAEYKSEICVEHNIDILIDDAWDILVGLPKNVSGIGIL